MRVFILIFLLLSTLGVESQSVAEAYIAKFDSLAVEVLNVYGIPASLVLGLAMQESAAGTSKLCKTKHNHFGLKGRVKSSKTKSGYITTYRKFETDEECYLFFGEMISKRKYYSDLKCNMNYMKWLKAMKAARYATSSSWISHVDKMIKRYDLTRFDALPDAMPIPVISDTTTSSPK
ncbi:MAG: glucosaminidase domain-containing protein [Bacteroidales bacterium]